MKRNTIALLVVLLLGALTFWLVSHRDRSSLKKELRDFAYADTGSITKVFLADKSLHEVTLTREKVDGVMQWKVNGKYIARPDAIYYLLQTVHDLSIKEPVSNKAKPGVIKQLASGAIKCQLFVGDKLVKQFYVGGADQEETGTYMLLSDVSDPDDPINSTEPFVMEVKGVNAYLTTRFSTKEGEWRDRTCFKYFAPDIRSITVEHKDHPEQSFTVTQSADNRTYTVTTKDGKTVLPIDTIAVRQFISYFGHINFENFDNTLTKEHQDSITNSHWEHRITITDASNKSNEALMWLKKNDGFMPDDTTAAAPPPFDPDHMFGLVNNKQDFVVINYYVFGKLLVTPDYFLPRKKEVPIK
ncbi:MAG TPA: hypothetical protein VL651_12815 [Bacteroidia bacterium]|jgi:hypothetical protein|nr:hypothetical protein [Bacteroidia bacterium]